MVQTASTSVTAEATQYARNCRVSILLVSTLNISTRPTDLFFVNTCNSNGRNCSAAGRRRESSRMGDACAG
jgi:hypothetical protein